MDWLVLGVAGVFAARHTQNSLRLMDLEIQQGSAEVNGTRLYYEAAGSGQPLVLLHGFSLDTRMWDGQFEAFAVRCRVIRYDLRGFGKSALPTSARYMHAEDLRALLEHLGAVPAHLLGLSLGGGIAIDFALTFPEAVRTLIPVDSTLGGFTWSVDWRLEGARAREAGVEAAKELWLKHAQFEPARENPAVFARLKQMVGDYSGWHWLNRDPGHGPEPPANDRLEQLRAPALVVVGGRDLPDFHRIADRLEHHLPNARKIYLEGVGHLASMEAPERFNEIVFGFLAAV